MGILSSWAGARSIWDLKNMDVALVFWALGHSFTTYERALAWQPCRASMQLNMGLLIHGCALDKFNLFLGMPHMY